WGYRRRRVASRPTPGNVCFTSSFAIPGSESRRTSSRASSTRSCRPMARRRDVTAGPAPGPRARRRSVGRGGGGGGGGRERGPAGSWGRGGEGGGGGGRRLRMLGGEDNGVNQKLAIRILEKQGHRVVVVDDGQAAVATLEREDFDLVLMDVQMPVMDGFEAT